MNDIDHRIKSILVDILEIPVDSLLDSSGPSTIEAWDSVNHLNIVLALEQEFNIKIQPEQFELMNSLTKISEIVRFLKK